MRTRNEIEENIKNNRRNYYKEKVSLDQELVIELLLDIRDLLPVDNSPNQDKS